LVLVWSSFLRVPPHAVGATARVTKTCPTGDTTATSGAGSSTSGAGGEMTSTGGGGEGAGGAESAPVVDVTVGKNHTYARLQTGDAYCWDENENGQIGDGTEIDRTTPTDVGLTVRDVEAGFAHTCAVKMRAFADTISV